jgi:hypothetical protein
MLIKPDRTAFVLLMILGSVCLQTRSYADENQDVAFFEQKIRPVLIQYCYECHSEKSKELKGGLLLDSKAGWQRGGDSGDPIIVPGKPEESTLLKAVRHQGGLEMPPETKLPSSAIADLSTWIKAGAIDPRDGVVAAKQKADHSWWSLQPLKDVEPPVVSGVEQPIDRFIAAKLKAQGITPNPPAEPRALIRRMNYDLLGLPPAPEEVEAFITAFKKDSQAAVEALVDRLLASPHYGEQWGRHWLDVVRFGESNGFERNVIVDDAWPFRDYVINSINNDKPFDQFIIEHLAGDVVGKDQPEIEIGSAFLTTGPYDDVGNQDVVAQANIRAATLDDMITATSGAFLGLTVNCARCHHHKFDPIPAEDYYRLRAAFEGTSHGRRVVATAAELQAHAEATKSLNDTKAKISAEATEIEKTIAASVRKILADRKFTRPKVDPQSTAERFEPIEARYVKLILHAHTGNAKSAVGSRLTEFEVWTAGQESRNVALASNGAAAAGERSAKAEDFPAAYGPQLTIDGAYAEQWFVGSPAELVISLAKPEVIERIVFGNSRGIDQQRKGVQGETPCEYDVQVSLDGKDWRTVATGTDREPWSPAHGIERIKREAQSSESDPELRESLVKQLAVEKELAKVQKELATIKPLRQVWIGAHAQPKSPTLLHKGGDPMKPGEIVAPAALEVLSRTTKTYKLPADAPEGERRLALARWIVADDNPLSARVLANRVWQYHFGVGLVDTPSDFGYLGGRPSHPELLDWLAGRLRAHGWRLKPLHREILLSETYRRSATFRADAAGIDKDSRLLWRFPPRRLSAEELRDTLLFIAGKLDTKRGGPGFRLYKFSQNNVCTYTPLDEHGPETYRRAVYHQNARASVVDLLNDFDLPDNAFAAPKRTTTTTPLQALTLLNHRFTLDMAAALAARAEQSVGSTDRAALVDAVYRLSLSRAPSDKERAAASKLLEQYGTRSLCRAILNLNEVLYVE